MRKKLAHSWMKHPRLVPAALVLGFLLAIGGTVGAATSSGTFLDLVAEKVATLLVSGNQSAPAEDAEFGATFVAPGGDVGDVSTISLLGFKDPDRDAVVIEGWEYGKIGTASSTFLSIRNQYSEPIYVDRALFQLVGTASTTINFSFATSTRRAFAYDARTSADLNFPTIIDHARVATSTGDYFFDAGYGPMQYAGTATGTNKMVRVGQNEYLLGFMGAENLRWAVTSSAERGFTVDSWYAIHYLRFSTSTPQ